MKQFLFFGWLCFLIMSCTVAQEGYQLKSTVTKEINGVRFYVHQVKKQQTLYSIARAYGVNMQDIIDRNPEIRNGLKAGQSLLIPITDNTAVSPAPPSLPPVDAPPPLAPPPQVINPDPEYGVDAETGKKTCNVAFLTHFFLANPGTISVTDPTLYEIEHYKPFRYIQFYEGFLMAVDSLKRRGENFNIYIYDVDPSESGTEKILKKPEMTDMDLIVGMLYNESFQVVASWAKKQHIPLVSPVSERESQVQGNPMVIKIRPPQQTETLELATYLAQHAAFDRILLVRGSEASAAATANKVIEDCHNQGLEVKHVTIDQLPANLSPDGRTVILAVSAQKSVALNILTRLNATEQTRDIAVFGIPRWDQFEGMDFELMEKSNTHILVPYSLDRYKQITNRFTALFQQTYFTFPEMLAYEGYDLGLYFLHALFTYGKSFPDLLPELEQRPLMTKFKFFRVEDGGWENGHWDILRFSNYALDPVN